VLLLPQWCAERPLQNLRIHLDDPVAERTDEFEEMCARSRFVKAKLVLTQESRTSATIE
jgi:hypothetical protein